VAREGAGLEQVGRTAAELAGQEKPVLPPASAKPSSVFGGTL